MKINLAKSAGFCFGVKRALDIAIETAQNKEKVVMLGDIVHNERVVQKITQSGIKKVNSLKPSKNQILLIRAHGEPKKVFNSARRLGYKIVDATCPMVKEIHKIVNSMGDKGYTIIVIGDKKHDEVRGITGQVKKKSLVIEKLSCLPLAKIKRVKKAAVVVQSTQNLNNALKIVESLKKYIPNLRFFNTICKPTQIKQAEIKNMPKNNNCMIIIGSKKSANTKRLYEISKRLNKNSWRVNSKKEIKPAWVKNAKSIGITAGASTPKETIDEIIRYLSNPPLS
ncbi:MAG: 4-hydroxy-3-methylbut-2-enyl diphosphate reductase [Candidatus Omnitrophica bacterium]|jgi:4-hydroxy-3-methylbut-2-enyl diphosphate reductase|nr:4-hydroxy-3-methylbut-2-enyl diphosphate reductase [Candidatus Omnitrophota bacterium]MDD3987701.1 4-hydroxy-3-methylbut-2-enyl diphosphate reductase [Candidatus Omnitrophota bacterium]MDD4981883.1 4-hydroxy-3-methylbut-2-enyl diphosphate reductase [Candidatus Omnitrophota bacterium]MDD5665112.1 4-hydroxy-3-methylbut-2-enyl diphosphate reductase [Candidatus Omnitrophota bacterium]